MARTKKTVAKKAENTEEKVRPDAQSAPVEVQFDTAIGKMADASDQYTIRKELVEMEKSKVKHQCDEITKRRESAEKYMRGNRRICMAWICLYPFFIAALEWWRLPSSNCTYFGIAVVICLLGGEAVSLLKMFVSNVTKSRNEVDSQAQTVS